MNCTTYGKRNGSSRYSEFGGWLRKMGSPFLGAVCGAVLFMAGSASAQNQQQSGNTLNIGFGSPDIRYEETWNNAKTGQSENINLADTYTVNAWKGERVGMQLLVQTGKEISDLQVLPGDLRLTNTGTGNKGVISASAIKTGFVRYVLSNGVGKSGSGCGIDTATQHLAFIVADGIEYKKRTSVKANKNQPIWLTLQVPADAAPGNYKGQLEVSYVVAGTDGKTQAPQKKTLSYEVTVNKRTLPAPAAWKFHLDLWQYPESIARWYHVKPWSEEHFAKMKPYMKMLADAGQKVITTSIINDPWNGQTYDPYTSMVQWTKKKDGTWRYDYSIFDKWVSYMMSLGIGQQINCYSMVPWHNTFAYFDEASGEDKALVAKPGTAEYNKFWKGMLVDFAKHLKKKGWFNITTIAMDERPLESMEKVIQLIKDLPDPFKISLAGGYHPSLDKDIYDYCIPTREKFDSDVLSRRKKANLPTTYYTCCTEDHPNTFSFSPPAEAAFIPLLAASRNLSGYLRWAYNAWPSTPWTDSRFGSWSSGDTYFVYPGPGSSIRYEQLIRGIQDFEKIRLIKKQLAADNNQEGLQKINQVLSDCTVESLRKNGASKLVGAVESTIDKF